jgi:hypothetical protein
MESPAILEDHGFKAASDTNSAGALPPVFGHLRVKKMRVD